MSAETQTGQTLVWTLRPSQPPYWEPAWRSFTGTTAAAKRNVPLSRYEEVATPPQPTEASGSWLALTACLWSLSHFTAPCVTLAPGRWHRGKRGQREGLQISQRRVPTPFIGGFQSAWLSPRLQDTSSDWAAPNPRLVFYATEEFLRGKTENTRGGSDFYPANNSLKYRQNLWSCTRERT